MILSPPPPFSNFFFFFFFLFESAQGIMIHLLGALDMTGVIGCICTL